MTLAPAVWLLRINPLARQRLADPELAARLAGLVALEQIIPRLAIEASDDLHALVPRVAGDVRRRILALRRDIHNDRPVALPPAVALPPEVPLPASVGRWVEHCEQRRRCQEEIVDRYDDVLAGERTGLRERLGEDDFLTTLAQSAAGVFEDACHYRRRDTVDSKDRKAERALVQFITRAMVRTSPYGRFTAVGLAAPGPGGVGLDAAVPDGATPQVEVDRVMFDYVVGGLVGAEHGDPWLMVPPTARRSDDRITFFQVGPTALRRLAAPLAGHTRVVVDLLAAGPRRRSALVAALADDARVERAEAERLLTRALQVGLLVTAWRGDEFVADPVTAAREDLAATDPATSDRRAALEGLRRFEAALDDLRRPLDAHAATAASQRVLAGGDELSGLAHRPARLAVYEDFVLDPFTVDPAAHHAALDDLAAVTELLCAFDRTHVVRAALAEALVHRFGPGCQIPLVANAEALVRSVYRAERLFDEAPDALVGPSDGSLAVLAKVRAAARRALEDRLVAGGDGVCWRPDEVMDLVGDLPERFRQDPASYGLVVQPAGRDLVVNDTYAGHGPMVSRFLHADAVRGGDAITRLRHGLRALYGPDTHLLEDLGGHGLSINAHPRILDVAPAGGEASSTGVDAERWMRLQLRHDADSDTVTIVDRDRPVVVLALGAQLPEFLPYPVRLASWLSSSGRVLLDIPAQVRRPAGGVATVGFPRLRVGRVILARRRWYLGEDFPARRDCAGDAGYLLALTRWRAAHAVPAEVVFKSAFDGPTMWDNLRAAGAQDRFLELRRQAKPQYVDLASALMTRVLPRLLERRAAGYVEEALPALGAGGHALEWMIPMTRPAGGRHFDWRGPAPEWR